MQDRAGQDTAMQGVSGQEERRQGDKGDKGDKGDEGYKGTRTLGESKKAPAGRTEVVGWVEVP